MRELENQHFTTLNETTGKGAIIGDTLIWEKINGELYKGEAIWRTQHRLWRILIKIAEPESNQASREIFHL